MSYIWRDPDTSRWCIGPEVGGTPDYWSRPTDKRTPPRGPYFPAREGIEGKYKTLPSCTGRLWWPWCNCPCTPLFYDGCVEITCTTGDCPEEALGIYYPYGVSEWGAWEFRNSDGWLLWVDNDKRTWMIGETKTAEDYFSRRAKTPIGEFQGQGAYAGMVVTGADVECPTKTCYNDCTVAESFQVTIDTPLASERCDCSSTAGHFCLGPGTIGGPDWLCKWGMSRPFCEYNGGVYHHIIRLGLIASGDGWFLRAGVGFAWYAGPQDEPVISPVWTATYDSEVQTGCDALFDVPEAITLTLTGITSYEIGPCAAGSVPQTITAIALK